MALQSKLIPNGMEEEPVENGIVLGIKVSKLLIIH